MTKHIVYNGVPRTSDDVDHNQHAYPQLFAGQKLWFHHHIPQRKWLIDNAKLYGATIVDLDKQADIRLVDHARKQVAPGTHSYRYVELSIRKGELENLADHAVGLPTRAARPVGSTATAPRTSRMNYTPEEDQFLWNWMKPFEESGGAVKGNEIYKQIERVNPRHTWQSWRDRWLKITQFQKRQITTPSVEAQQQPEVHMPQSSLQPQPKKRRREVSDEGDRERAVRDQEQEQRPVKAAHTSQKTTEPFPGAGLGEPVVDPAVSQTLSNPSNRGLKQRAHPTSTPPPCRPIRPLSPGEFKQLYHLVPKLTDVSIEDFDKTWNEIASSADHKGHTAEEWKHHWVSTVVPTYCRKNGKTIEEVAPYLLDQREKGRVADGADSHVSKTVKRAEATVCSNCFTDESGKWRVDEDGNSLCNPCAAFLRIHGVPRPSMMGAGVGRDDAQLTLHSVKAPPAAPRLPDPTVVTPASSDVNQGVQNFLADTDEKAQSDHPAPPRDRQNPPPPESPTFQPESPTLVRRPEPNEARKRNAGRGAQSQSTDSSRNLGPQAQLQASFGTAIEKMGEVQSKETGVQHQRIPPQEICTGVPTFQYSSKAGGNRPLLLDDPTTLDIEQDSSSSPGQGPPRDPAAAHHRSGPHQDEATRKRQKVTSTASPVLSPGHSPLSVFEDEEDGEVDEPRPELRPDDDVSSVSATSSFDVSNANSELDEESQSGRVADPGRSRTVTEHYETVPESLQSWKTAPETQQLQRRKRATTQELFDDPELGAGAMTLDVDLPAPEGGWDAVLDSQSGDVYAEYREISNLNVQGREALEAGEPVDNVATNLDPETGFDLLPPPPADSQFPETQGSAGTTHEAEARKVDDWIALQRELHPTVKKIEPVLFKALQATTFDLALATEVVRIMLGNLRRQNKRRRSNIVAQNEVVVPRNMKGVWTEEDDNLLFSSNARDIGRVLDKHGPKGCDARLELLDKLAQA